MKRSARADLLPVWPWWFALIGLMSLWNVSKPEDVVLRLQNGDRLTGHVVSVDTNTLVLAPAYSGPVTIPCSEIVSQERVPAVTGTNPPPLARATGIASELVLTNKPPTLQSTNRSGFRRFLSEWHGEAQLGANLGFSTVNREAFTGHMKLTENHAFAGTERSLRNILEYDVAYGRTDGVLSDNRMEGNLKTEYDLGKRFFIYNAADAGYDQIRTINFQYDVGPGVGYKWVVLSNFVFKTELGADYQEQYFQAEPPTSRYALRLDEDLWWQISRKIRWDEKTEFFPELDNVSEYRIRFETNLSYLLKQNITFSLNLIDQYDTGLPSDVTRNDLQIRTLLGVKF